MTLLYKCVYVCGCVMVCGCVVFVHSWKLLALFSQSYYFSIAILYGNSSEVSLWQSDPFLCDESTNCLPFPNTWLSVKSSQDPHPGLYPQKRAVLCSIVPWIVFDSLSPLAFVQLTKVVLVCRNSSLLSGWSVKRPYHSYVPNSSPVQEVGSEMPKALKGQ